MAAKINRIPGASGYNEQHPEFEYELVNLCRYLLLLSVCISTGLQAQLPVESGGLEAYLGGITFGAENDGRFKIRDESRQ